MTSDDYDIALIEGAISRADEVERLQEIRASAKVLVALGSCACYGGVNRLKNAFDLAEANREVYGDQPKETLPVRPVKEVVHGRPGDPRLPGVQGRGGADRPAPDLGHPLQLPGLPGLPGVQAALHGLPVRAGASSAWARSPGGAATRPARPAAWAAGAAAGRPRSRTMRNSMSWPAPRGSASGRSPSGSSFFGGFEGVQMKVDLDVDVHHLTRVEGHGNIRLKVEDGIVKEARWDVVETPRFFEVMLKGKHYTSAGILTARICGICSIGHCLASAAGQRDGLRGDDPGGGSQAAAAGQAWRDPAEPLAAPVLPGRARLSRPAQCPPAAGDQTRRWSIWRAGSKGSATGSATRLPAAPSIRCRCRWAVWRSCRRGRNCSRCAMSSTGRWRISTLPAGCSAASRCPTFARETEFVSLKGETEYPWIGGSWSPPTAWTWRESDYLQDDQRVRDDAQHLQVVQALPPVVRRRRPGALQQQLPAAAPGGGQGGRSCSAWRRSATTRS